DHYEDWAGDKATRSGNPATRFGVAQRRSLFFVRATLMILEEPVASSSNVRHKPAKDRSWPQVFTSISQLAERKSVLVTLFVLFSVLDGFFVFGHVYWRDEAMPLLIVAHNPR